MDWIVCIITFAIGYVMGIITAIYDKNEREKRRIIKMEKMANKMNDNKN